MNMNPTSLLAYNKFNNDGCQGTLIANWKEERDLIEATGNTRTKFNNHLPKKREDLFTKSPEELTNLHKIEDQDDTHERTLGKKYVDFPNSFNSEYGKGVNKADQLRTVGAKSQMRDKFFLEQIKDEIKEMENQEQKEANSRQFVTTTQAEFHQKDNSGNTVGRRVMKTQDGQHLGLENRDYDLLNETGQLPRQQFLTDDELKQYLPSGESYLTQQPITFWQEKQNDGAFYMSKQNAVNPKATFAKNDTFCQTYSDYSHVKK